VKYPFNDVILRPFGGGPNFAGVPPEPRSPCKISCQWIPVCRSYFRKWISYDRII